MAIRAIVFDLFDTLVDLYMENIPRRDFEGRSLPGTAPELFDAVAERAEVSYRDFAVALSEVDRAFLRSRYADGLELPTEERFTALVEQLELDEPELPRALTEIHMGRLLDEVAVPPHHAGVLDELREGFHLAVCSNFSHSETAVAVLEQAQLLTHFDVVVVSESVGIRKPRPEIFESVLNRLGLEPGEALHVGDSLRADVAGAAAVGMRTAWITRRVADPERAVGRYEGPAPEAHVADLAELVGLLAAEAWGPGRR